MPPIDMAAEGQQEEDIYLHRPEAREARGEYQCVPPSSLPASFASFGGRGGVGEGMALRRARCSSCSFPAVRDTACQ